MPDNIDLKDLDFNNFYILCICEGKAECAIMDILLDNKMLIFDRSNLLDEKVYKRMTTNKLIENFLQFDYKKELIIFRVLDSKKEKLRLKKAYDRYEIYNFYTAHEIEFVFINYDNLNLEFQKKKSKMKASEFYKSQNKSYSKGYDYVKNYFCDVNKLCESLKKSKSKNYLGISDLLK
ncbi:hypothetical protein [Peptoniphilus catoniae]|uniref:hypothetical protein n=1 Tax=Peptoniphilus catoniae TaxID=1660341 RepID=UPI0010FEF650|nr:hypothetical protein [Peptoniphilus catoniae]